MSTIQTISNRTTSALEPAFTLSAFASSAIAVASFPAPKIPICIVNAPPLQKMLHADSALLCQLAPLAR